ncbi:Ferredoxin [Sporomusa ovata]|uniref:Ferredoxin n=1 Tax=Sporomusa ovata TaxID=2378 RepID=A0A0U1KUC9_9FIRM|nr:Ferredoxin [Sporomusa ovata]
MKATVYEIEVQKILVESEQQALKLEFVSSPTIRINGQDIQLDFKESLCESCGDVCGEAVDCRVWTWQGQEYTTPPKAMIVDAILRHVYGGQQASQQVSKDVPDNLKKFFAAKAKR